MRNSAYANTYGIPRNSGKFYCKKYRGIPYVFTKIPYSGGSKKRTSVDTLAPARQLHRLAASILWNRFLGIFNVYKSDLEDLLLVNIIYTITDAVA
jgi:hypothetical protein